MGSWLVFWWSPARKVTPALVRGQQIAGRHTVPEPFAHGTTAQRQQWRQLIATMEGSLRLHRHRPGSLTKLDAYLHERTDGAIGSLPTDSRCRTEAILDGNECITRKTLDRIVDQDTEAVREQRRRNRRTRRTLIKTPRDTLHRLPVTPPPIHLETLGSYLHRLASLVGWPSAPVLLNVLQPAFCDPTPPITVHIHTPRSHRCRPGTFQPQTSSAVSMMRRSLARCSSWPSTLPSTVEEKPHCGERQSCSIGT